MLDWLCVIPVISSLFSHCEAPLPLAVGYVEGEYVLIAPIETALVTSLHVKRGERIAANQTLAKLEERDANIAVAQKQAALAQAVSQLDDSQRGKRPAEIAMIEATLNSAAAQSVEAARALRRQADLVKRGLGTQAALDKASTDVSIARAKTTELEATLAFARLPAREGTIKAAKANVMQAQAALEDAEWRLEKRSLTSLSAGTVFDIIRHPGEIAGPQAPVLSVLPDGAVKLRLYIPEAAVHGISAGMRLTVHCDGCTGQATATVSYVSDDPEYTPPVIYSLESRQKLVYLVEATPDDTAKALKPGQIVDVELAESSQ